MTRSIRIGGMASMLLLLVSAPFLRSVQLFIEDAMLHAEWSERLSERLLTSDRRIFIWDAAALADVHMEGEGREFAWQGRMYDVVRTDVLPSGEIRMVCLEDEQETRLKEEMSDMVGTGWNTRATKQVMFALLFGLFQNGASPIMPMAIDTPLQSVHEHMVALLPMPRSGPFQPPRQSPV
ncbi:MAG: hypothetical protein H6594_08860 [Flavobacteriales bacterium]|nr:hypothetical protein [Flavobacteriales bacterium]MCB9170443.1 hypothetical protein [Flavobacteriales bacterium]